MIVLLLFAYPLIGANQLVGTDLTQAVPLTLAAAIGALLFGHVEFGVTGSLIIGSVPGVLVGSLLSSTIPDRYVRPVIGLVIFASGLKYVGASNVTLLGAAGGLAVLLLCWLAVSTLLRAQRTPEQVGAERAPEPSAAGVQIQRSV
jgi:hypothetical protein